MKEQQDEKDRIAKDKTENLTKRYSIAREVLKKIEEEKIVFKGSESGNCVCATTCRCFRLSLKVHNNTYNEIETRRITITLERDFREKIT